MKKFNQMSENQMSKINGGFIGLIIGGIAAFVGGTYGAAYGIHKLANSK